MGLSSNTLLQQTSFESLKGILSKQAFKLSYCLEELHYTEGTPYQHVFPMVCFSEIPVSSLHNHLGRYGKCIIGMKKDWAIKNGLSQVNYYQRNSLLAKNVVETYDDIYGKVKKGLGSTEEMKVFLHLEYQMAFAKNYMGSVNTEHYKNKNYVFAEEKEWRYVPLKEEKALTLSLDPDNFIDDKQKYQEEIGRKTLKFELKDINFIITDRRDEIQSLLYLNKDLLKECNRGINIFTNKEIRNNFFGYANESMHEYNMKQQILEYQVELRSLRSETK